MGERISELWDRLYCEVVGNKSSLAPPEALTFDISGKEAKIKVGSLSNWHLVRFLILLAGAGAGSGTAAGAAVGEGRNAAGYGKGEGEGAGEGQV